MEDENNKLVPDEYRERQLFIYWSNFHPIFKDDPIINIENKTARRKLGLSDYFIAYIPKNSNYHGFFIEMKRRDPALSTVSNCQRIFLNKKYQKGYAVSVTYGFEHAKKLIENYLKGLEIFNNSNLNCTDARKNIKELFEVCI